MQDKPLIPLANVFSTETVSNPSPLTVEQDFLAWLKDQPGLVSKFDEATSLPPSKNPKLHYAPNGNWDFNNTIRDRGIEDLAKTLLHYVTVATVRETLNLPLGPERRLLGPDNLTVMAFLDNVLEALQAASKRQDLTEHEASLSNDLSAIAELLKSDNHLGELRHRCAHSLIFSDSGQRMIDARSVWYRTRCLAQRDMLGNPLLLNDLVWTWWLAGMCELIEKKEFDQARLMAERKTFPQLKDTYQYEFLEQLVTLSDGQLATFQKAIAPAIASSAFTAETLPGSFTDEWEGQYIVPSQLDDAQSYLFKGGGFYNRLHWLVDNLHQGVLSEADILDAHHEQTRLLYSPIATDLVESMNPNLGSALFWATPAPKTTDEMIGRVSWIFNNPDLLGIQGHNLRGAIMQPVRYAMIQELPRWCADQGIEIDKEVMRTLKLDSAVLKMLKLDIHPKLSLILYNMDSGLADSDKASGIDKTWQEFLTFAKMQAWLDEKPEYPTPLSQPIADALARAIDERMQMACIHEDVEEFEFGPDLFLPTSEKEDRREMNLVADVATMGACRCCGNPRVFTRLDPAPRKESLVQGHRAFAAASLVLQGAVSLTDLNQGLEALAQERPELFETRARPQLGISQDASAPDDIDWADSFSL